MAASEGGEGRGWEDEWSVRGGLYERCIAAQPDICLSERGPLLTAHGQNTGTVKRQTE